MNGAPLRVPRSFLRAPRACGGWSLAELTLVLVIAAVLGYLAIVRFQPLEVQSQQQADLLRNDLRHAQMLALAWGRALRVTAGAGAYSVACVTAGTAPCDASPVIDPATGKPFSVTLASGLTLTGPGFALDFDTLGRPRNGASLITANATYTVSGGGSPRSVVVSPITGFALIP